ncbi:MAG TPA: glycine cleavage T C-terminal barrel domain-containing protein, partial [Candidatus Limnocylindrales bacterium]|nr:glycine cleavage T C-terminal barrel domain-containing protein [Candidatus Limnocylindrales bacterium]
WGPRARDVLREVTDGAVDDAALPVRQARTIRIRRGVGGGGADARASAAEVLATRLSYAGELGWELTVRPSDAEAVWDAIAGAGRTHGLEPIGYRALESLRLEKGFRYFGAELTPRETPFEAGMDRFVRLDKPGGFVGRDALVARRQTDPDGPTRRLRTLVMGGGDWIPVYGGEAVRLDGAVIGRLRSAAFGYTIGRTIGTAYLPVSLPEGAAVEVDVFADRLTAEVAPDVLVDPTGTRMRG